ncbi:MAG: DUF3857 domain-containing protein [Ferruginibacter sp.]
MKTINSIVGILLLCVLMPFSLIAQKDVPSFGKVDKADLEMKQCPNDPGAEAMVLFDVGEAYCYLDLNSVGRPLSSQMERHVRIKIFNSKGFDQANIKIRFLAEYGVEDIRGLSAQTINMGPDGNPVITKVEKSSIFTRKIDKRRSEITFAFPDVKAGSIIEYKYKDDANWLYAVKRWYFQRSIPVRYSRYTIDFPNEFTFSAQPQGLLVVKQEKSETNTRTIRTFKMNDVPALRDEAYISCEEDYWQQVVPFLVSLNLPGQVSTNLLRTWPKIVKELMDDEDFGQQLKKNVPRTADLDAMLKQTDDQYKKMTIIYDYVKSKMEWNEIYGIWALDGIKSAWRDKKGTSGEINLILVNLLKDADLNAHPVLVSTRDNGRINTSIAGYDQFDKVVASVKIADKEYVLDATNKLNHPDLIPLDVICSEGLLIEKYDSYQWGWKLLWNDSQKYQDIIIIQAKADEKGTQTGTVVVNSSGYSRLQKVMDLQKGKESFRKKYFNTEENNLVIDSLEITNQYADSLPLLQTCKFSRSSGNSGGYNYFAANIFSGFEKNPFIADSRTSDVFYGTNQYHMINATFEIPEGYSFESLPANMKMRTPDSSIIFSRLVQVDGNRLMMKIDISFLKPIYYADEYEVFHEFMKKMYALLNEQFVYKKN